MKALKRISLAVAGLCVVTLAIAFFLPKNWRADQSIVINKDIASIYAAVSSLEAWPTWTVWNQQADPSVTFTFEGQKSSEGSSQSWQGDKLGTGRIVITKADGQVVEYDFFFNGSDVANKGKIELMGEGEGQTNVRWISEGTSEGNPLTRYMGPIIAKMVNKNLKDGLANLKNLVESQENVEVAPEANAEDSAKKEEAADTNNG